MKKRRIALIALGVLALGVGTAAYVATPTIHEGVPGEAPELGRYGSYVVGTQELEFSLPNRVTFGKVGMATGATDTETRDLAVRMYYPAKEAGAMTVSYSHIFAPPAMEPVALEFSGRAYSDATPLSEGETFPLVVMSHGFNGWSTQFSNLAEHIASRGYIVASIDHDDMKLESSADFLHSFAKVLASRSLDQRQVLADILERSRVPSESPFSMIDPERVGLIGYSMGGYGALATGGGDYDYDSSTFTAVPSDAMTPVQEAASEPVPVNAIVTFAPWGGQPDNRVWSAETLGKVDVPVLLVSGNQDDVSNYDEGVRWIFDSLTSSDRHMLVYREARHNIVGNAFDLPEDVPFRAAEFVMEPVWRQGRINAINQHFVAAFLDMTLKSETEKAAYLNMPSVDANDSVWEVSTGEQLNGKLAGEEEAEHWRGFQRRWAVGLEFYSKAAGE